MKINYIKPFLGAICLLSIIYAVWAPKGMSRQGWADKDDCYTQISPKASFRVDICHPAPPYFSLDKEMPRFVRFYDQRTRQPLGESDIIDMSGRGEVLWPLEDRLSITVGLGDDAPEIKVTHLDGQN